MSLKQCRECSASVSTTAAACPRCGARSPTGSRARTVIAWAILFPLLFATAFPAVMAVLVWSYRTITGSPTAVVITAPRL